MGVKALFAPQIGGGVPFCMLYIASGHQTAFIAPAALSLAVPALVCLLLLEFFCSLSPPAFHASIVADFHTIMAKRGKNMAKVNIYLLVFVLPS